MNNTALLAPSELVKIYEKQLGMDIEPIYLPVKIEYDNVSMTTQESGYFLSQLQQWVLEKYGWVCDVRFSHFAAKDKMKFEWFLHKWGESYTYRSYSKGYFKTHSFALLDALKRVPELVKGEKP